MSYYNPSLIFYNYTIKQIPILFQADLNTLLVFIIICKEIKTLDPLKSTNFKYIKNDVRRKLLTSKEGKTINN